MINFHFWFHTVSTCFLSAGEQLLWVCHYWTSVTDTSSPQPRPSVISKPCFHCCTADDVTTLSRCLFLLHELFPPSDGSLQPIRGCLQTLCSLCLGGSCKHLHSEKQNMSRLTKYSWLCLNRKVFLVLQMTHLEIFTLALCWVMLRGRRGQETVAVGVDSTL